MKIEVITIEKGQRATVSGNNHKLILSLPPLTPIFIKDVINETRLSLKVGWSHDRIEKELNHVIDLHG